MSFFLIFNDSNLRVTGAHNFPYKEWEKAFQTYLGKKKSDPSVKPDCYFMIGRTAHFEYCHITTKVSVLSKKSESSGTLTELPAKSLTSFERLFSSTVPQYIKTEVTVPAVTLIPIEKTDKVGDVKKRIDRYNPEEIIILFDNKPAADGEYFFRLVVNRKEGTRRVSHEELAQDPNHNGEDVHILQENPRIIYKRIVTPVVKTTLSPSPGVGITTESSAGTPARPKTLRERVREKATHLFSK